MGGLMGMSNSQTDIRKAENDAMELFSSHIYEYYKLMHFKDQSLRFKEISAEYKIDEFLQKTINNELFLDIHEEKKDIFYKQAYNHSIIFLGISLFEKCCKDWFSWGLRHNSERMRAHKDKEIKIEKLLNTRDGKDIVSHEITAKIKFLDLKECDKAFDKTFQFKLFNNDEKNKFKEFIIDRNLIAHNSGFIDRKYINDKNLDDKQFGNLLIIPDSTINSFIEDILAFINKFSEFKPKIIDQI